MKSILIKNATIVNENNTPSLWQTRNNLFYIENYVDQSGGEYPKPQLQITGTEGNDNVPIRLIQYTDATANRIYFFFKNDGDLVYSGPHLGEEFDLISISVIINA